MQFEIEVNSKKIQAKRGETILLALNRNGIKVPTLCNMKDFSPSGACRICAVELEGKNNLVTSCSTPVEESMKIRTHSPRVIRARKTIVELLLSNHPDDCLYCENNGTCELQKLSVDLNIRERRISGKKSRHKLDLSSPGLIREPAKCILCGRCVRVCDEQQSVSTLDFVNRGSKTNIGTAMQQDLNFSSCIFCGQCVMVCPTGALHEKSSIDELVDALNNPSLNVVVQFDPSVSISLIEEFGIKPGKDLNGIICSALQKIGFNKIFDTSFAADLAILEVTEELKTKLETNSNLPLITSNCPSWIKYCEQFHPDLIPNLSTTKSPQQILGSIIKSQISDEFKVDQGTIFSVSIVPCLARKFEAQREEMTNKAISDVDLVITTRELIKLINMYGIDIQNIDPITSYLPSGFRSSAGKLFSVSGGTAEGVLRSLHNSLSGREMMNTKMLELRAVNSSKEIELKIGGKSVKILIVNGLKNIEKVLQAVKNRNIDVHFIEIMACEGGCVNGGGQSLNTTEKEIKSRTKNIYDQDDSDTIKVAHRNPVIIDFYEKNLDKPGSEKSKKVLHTRYSKRVGLL